MNTQNKEERFSLYSMSPINEHYSGYLQVALHLSCTITLLHPYNGHIPRIFPDVHVISLIQVECATAQTGPQLQIVLFGLLDEDHVACRLLLADSRIARSSLVFGFRPEDERGLRGSLLTPP